MSRLYSEYPGQSLGRACAYCSDGVPRYVSVRIGQISGPAPVLLCEKCAKELAGELMKLGTAADEPKKGDAAKKKTRKSKAGTLSAPPDSNQSSSMINKTPSTLSKTVIPARLMKYLR